ncbi:hypothetical protein IV53_GL001215 [Ligilactobacillus ceti DSM 22408]|uniref:Uncharacterized protein n=1 Tax=Ligilactobacillus ceti DSM 22408 TaxID=1122146 RepID=A0A0R2KJI0_9LACO|nr:hypothetical protein IV53_GL001215 [Ligilactobacillus ceti DSM 22408]
MVVMFLPLIVAYIYLKTNHDNHRLYIDMELSGKPDGRVFKKLKKPLFRSSEIMVINETGRFYNLYAPEISILPQNDHQIAPKVSARIAHLALDLKTNWYPNMKLSRIHQGMESDEGVIEYTFLNDIDVVVESNVIIQGDLRCQKSITIQDNVTICGNVYAYGKVDIGKNVVILGNVLTRDDLVIGEGTVIGQKYQIVSVISREDLYFKGNNYVYGYVHCQMGFIGDALDKVQLVSFSEQKLPHITKLILNNLEEYEALEPAIYAHEPYLKEVILPNGLTKIEKRMFFGAKSLEKVVLPPTLTKIEEYAFGDCYHLESELDLSHTEIVTIENNAFKSCNSLIKVKFPTSLKEVGRAAFNDCQHLAELDFGSQSQLEIIAEHSFKQCFALKEVYIPDQVTEVGMSAFYNCPNLVKVSVPKICETQPGIQELIANGVVVELR